MSENFGGSGLPDRYSEPIDSSIESVSVAHDSVLVRPDFVGSVEIQLSDSEESPTVHLVHGRVAPQLRAEYILIQPDVIEKDPRRGWLPLGGVHYREVDVGRESSPQFDFDDDVAGAHCTIKGLGSNRLSIDDISADGRGITVKARSDDLLSD